MAKMTVTHVAWFLLVFLGCFVLIFVMWKAWILCDEHMCRTACEAQGASYRYSPPWAYGRVRAEGIQRHQADQVAALAGLGAGEWGCNPFDIVPAASVRTMSSNTSASSAGSRTLQIGAYSTCAGLATGKGNTFPECSH